MNPRDSAVARRQQLVELLGPVVQACGYDLEDVSVAAAGRRSVIRVIVDSDTGVDLDAVADISRSASEALEADSDAAFAGPYVLEVSSPGVDRPLTEQRHWRRATGRLVRTAVDGAPVRGRVISVSSATVRLDVDGAVLDAELGALAPGRVEVEFARPGQPEETDDGLIEAEDDADHEDIEHGEV